MPNTTQPKEISPVARFLVVDWWEIGNNRSLNKDIAAVSSQPLTRAISLVFLQKTTQNAIAAMSRLAELYADPNEVASSRQIAESRNLPVPVVAKILTELSRGGLVTAAPGPGGGYRLAKSPVEISLKDVVDLFEKENVTACPYGPNWCGKEAPCPLHHSLTALLQIHNDYLRNTNFSVFAQTTIASSNV